MGLIAVLLAPISSFPKKNGIFEIPMTARSMVISIPTSGPNYPKIMKTRLLLAKQTQVLLLESEKVREGPREGHRRTKAVYAHVNNPPH